MEVDDQERGDHPVAQEVDEHPELKEPNFAWQIGIEDCEQAPQHALQHTLHATYVAIDRGSEQDLDACTLSPGSESTSIARATAWAIRRFIDPNASSEFVPRTRDI